MSDPNWNSRCQRLLDVTEETSENLPAAVVASATMALLSRIGYIAHGAIYIFIGLLAARLAWGARGELAAPRGHWNSLTGCRRAALSSQVSPSASWRTPSGISFRRLQIPTVEAGQKRYRRQGSPDRQRIRIYRFTVFAGRVVAGQAHASDSTPNWAYRLLTEAVGTFAGAMVAIILLVVAGDDVRKACMANVGER